MWVYIVDKEWGRITTETFQNKSCKETPLELEMSQIPSKFEFPIPCNTTVYIEGATPLFPLNTITTSITPTFSIHPSPSIPKKQNQPPSCTSPQPSSSTPSSPPPSSPPPPPHKPASTTPPKAPDASNRLQTGPGPISTNALAAIPDVGSKIAPSV